MRLQGGWLSSVVQVEMVVYVCLAVMMVFCIICLHALFLPKF